MADTLYFFDQGGTREIQKRYRKLPEDLPESLRYAHLNPKVAAYLANKDKQKQQEDLFGDGQGKKSLLPEINQAFHYARNRLDSALSNDEDSQRYLFEESKVSSGSVLLQLSRYLYTFEKISSCVPRSLEYQIQSSYKDLIADTIFVPREWQTYTGKDSYIRSVTADGQSDDEDDDSADVSDGKRSRAGKSDDMKPKRRMPKIKTSDLPEILEDDKSQSHDSKQKGKRSESKMSSVPHSRNKDRLRVEPKHSYAGSDSTKRKKRDQSMGSKGTCSNCNENVGDMPLVVLTKIKATWNRYGALNPSYYMSTIQFQLSSKACEEKGWIIQKGKDDIERNTALEWCIQILQQSMKAANSQFAQDVELGHTKQPFVRYYGDTRKETLLKYRKSPVKQVPSAVMRGGQPKIPCLYDDRNEGKKLVQTCHTDGTSVVYYPSGRPAIIQSSAGFGRAGFYTIVYDDGIDSKMLACFTPKGRGCCYHSNGVVRFVGMQKEGQVVDEDGCSVNKWKWPSSTTVKITNPFAFPLNNKIGFKCISQSQMFVTFNCQKESAKFNVGPTVGAVEPKPGDEEHLLTNSTFSSRAARDLLKIYLPKKEKKKGKKKDKQRAQIMELQKMLELPEKGVFDTDADKELARLQRKSRNLVEDWLDHYRIWIGYRPKQIDHIPTRQNMSRLQAKSAKLSDRRVMDMDYIETTKKIRAPSAPTASNKRSSSSDRQKTPATHMVKFDDRAEDAGGDAPRVPSPTAIAVFNRLSESRGRSRSAKSRMSSRPTTGTYNRDRSTSPVPFQSNCPIALRQVMLGQERAQCRCSRHHIPFVTDIEFDEFISGEAPPQQLIVICIVSSLSPDRSPAEVMLQEIYSHQNLNRTRPCVQGRVDMYRILNYDIHTAAEFSDHTQPHLLTRHNVVPGMFLIYCASKLLFCDHIFNGYGNAKKDFKKQIMQCKLDSFRGYSLPHNFRFSVPQQSESGLRSAWGGEIGALNIEYGPGLSLDSAINSLTIHDNPQEDFTDATVFTMKIPPQQQRQEPEQFMTQLRLNTQLTSVPEVAT